MYECCEVHREISQHAGMQKFRMTEQLIKKYNFRFIFRGEINKIKQRESSTRIIESPLTHQMNKMRFFARTLHHHS